MASSVGNKKKRRSTTGSTKFDIEKFSRSNDFGLWRIKMQAILVHQGLDDGLKGESSLLATMSDKEKKDLIEKAKSTIILCLGDKALREVAREPIATTIWLKLESLYTTKLVANRLFLKQQLYFFKMTEERMLSDQIDDINKILDDIENLDVKMEDEDKALMLLHGLPSSYEHFKDAILFGRDQTITLEEVQSSIQTKEM
ncbi:Retrovirus-related Pol polyprotein from transposon TNT 1-94 [Glycine max]|nr:Retrovirus-related Pol polyprotein from transposon TNT 1-94 [Glycine max]